MSLSRCLLYIKSLFPVKVASDLPVAVRVRLSIPNLGFTGTLRQSHGRVYLNI